jgi:hypothetical protein
VHRVPGGVAAGEWGGGRGRERVRLWGTDEPARRRWVDAIRLRALSPAAVARLAALAVRLPPAAQPQPRSGRWER